MWSPTPAEGEVRAVAVGRKNWTFAESDEGGRRAVIATAKLNDIDPQTWLADVLARLPDHPARRIHDLLPWIARIAPQPKPPEQARPLVTITSARGLHGMRTPLTALRSPQ